MTLSHLVVKQEQIVIERCIETNKQDLDLSSTLRSRSTLIADLTSFCWLTIKNNALSTQGWLEEKHAHRREIKNDGQLHPKSILLGETRPPLERV